MNRIVQSFRELDVYQAAFDLQQRIFKASKSFPKEEMYALTDQLRRSSRSIGANIAEAWAKRRYSAHFLSKLTDSDGELQETLHWIETAFACEYFTEPQANELEQLAALIGRKLGRMMVNHERFCHA